MRKHWLLLFLLTVSGWQIAFSQQKTKIIQNIGVFAGGSYYFGDINPEKMFYDLSPAFGGFYNFWINKRYAVRTNVYYGGLKASGQDFDYSFLPLRNASFSESFLDMAIQFEFNFLPYGHDPRKILFTPYVAGGAGFVFIFGNPKVANQFVLPVNLGLKVNLSKKVDVGAEWGFRKTFNDYLDTWSPADPSVGLIPPDVKSFLHNNDWYSFVGIFASFKIFYDREICPAYWDSNDK
ncbi:MAG: outer membrane beta-barrel protein [Bacteroidales bacterium]|nr:outer membrane beta-barrel protein [Bacteroidales bacterium]